MTLRKQVSRGLKWQIINIAGKQLLSLVVFTTLARLLDPAAFGLLALIGVYTYFASMLADLGIGVALVQRKDLDKAHVDTAFWFNMGCNAALCAGTIALAGPIATLMGEPKLMPLLRWASLGLMFGAASAVQGTLFTKELDFRGPTIRTLIGNGVGGAVGVGMALAGFGVWALIGQLLAGSFAGAVFMCIASSYRPSFNFSFRHLRELLAVGSAVFANALIWFFSSRLDQLVIGRMAGVPVLGLYVISTKVPEMAKGATQQPIIDVSVPALARLQHDHERMREALYHGMELNTLVMFPMYVGIAATAHDLVPFLFGSKWAAAAPISSLLAIYYLFNSQQVFFYPALLASGVTGKYVLLNIAQSIGVLIACTIGIRFGIAYLVLGLILNNLTLVVPAMLLLRHRIQLSPLRYYRPGLIPACASLLMATSVWLLSALFPTGTSLLVRLIGEVTLGAGIYIAFIYLYKRTALVNLIQMVRHAIGISAKTSVGIVVAPTAE